jgi:hypothetical protein
VQISLEKPGSPAYVLEHFGTKGMRWGVRNKSSGPPAITKTKGWKAWDKASQKNVTGYNRGKAARTAFKKDNPTRQDRNQAIKKARFRQQTGEKLSQADRAVALRYTTGEKTVLSLLAVTGFATIPIAAISGTTVAIRRSRERKVVK